MFFVTSVFGQQVKLDLRARLGPNPLIGQLYLGIGKNGTPREGSSPILACLDHPCQHQNHHHNWQGKHWWPQSTCGGPKWPAPVQHSLLKPVLHKRALWQALEIRIYVDQILDGSTVCPGHVVGGLWQELPFALAFLWRVSPVACERREDLDQQDKRKVFVCYACCRSWVQSWLDLSNSTKD